jgi:hypothetical protein
MSRKLLLVGAGVLALTGQARAWDDFGHMEVAAAAFKKLDPKTKARAGALLKLNPRYGDWIVGAKKKDEARVAFMRAATWADSIKSDRAYKDDEQTSATAGQNIGYGDLFRHKYWHFVDRPFSPDGTPLVPAPAPNAATQIGVLKGALCSTTATDDLKSYDLSWLLHLVGDVHQPLHCVSRFDKADPAGDRGGNLVQITGNKQPPVCDDPRYCPFGPPAELHAFFDDITGSGYCVDEAQTAADGLPKPNATKAAVADETVWITEGVELAQSKVYVPPIAVGDGPFCVDEAYQKAALTMGKQQISLAAARLANLLNACLSK